MIKNQVLNGIFFQMKIHKKLFVGLYFSFVFATIFGTLSHEYGHYVVAKHFGYNASIHYKFTNWVDSENKKFIDSLFTKYQKEITSNKDFPLKEKFNEIITKTNKNNFWITLGGPTESMLTGSMGLFFLFLFKKSFKNLENLNFFQWVLIFSSLFWLRQTANFFIYLGTYLKSGQLNFSSDEVRIAYHLGFPHWSISFVTGIVGIIVLALITFKFIPKRIRIIFIIAGFLGGVSGYIFWLNLFGKYILP